MATWNDLCRENLNAAGECMRTGCFRSSVSRSYYAAYAAVAEGLKNQGVDFAWDRVGPAHSQVPAMITMNLARLSNTDRKRVKAAVNMLYEFRLDADYRPHRTVDRDVARRALIMATVIVGRLGVRA